MENKFKAVFITNDRKYRKSIEYFGANKKDVMQKVVRNGYIQDNNDIMYPMDNVISVRWKELNKDERN